MKHRIHGAWTIAAPLALALLSVSARAEDPPIVSGQGVRLHGTGPFEHVNIPLASATAARCDRFKLVKGVLTAFKRGTNVPCDDSDLAGTTFSAPYAGRFMRFSLNRAAPHRNIFEPPCEFNKACTDDPNGLREYEVSWSWERKSGALCAHSNAALAIPNAWSVSGELITNPAYFTFACLPARHYVTPFAGGGAIAKCVDWGYPPWAPAKSAPGDRSRTVMAAAGGARPDSDEEAYRLHQTCVRMATADYCGEGKANTLAGTPIAFYDRVTVKKKLENGGDLETPYNKDFLFEAVWGVDAQGRARALCFGKARWKTLALDATCLALERSPKPSLRRPPLCGTQTLKELEKQGALLFSYSTPFDKPFVLFRDEQQSKRNPGSQLTRIVSTSQVTLKDGYSESYELRLNPSSDAGELQGSLLNPALPQDLLIQMNTAALYRCRKESDDLPPLFLTTTDRSCEGAPGYHLDLSMGDGGLEGYLFTREEPERPLESLTLWRSDAGRYATSIQEPSKEYRPVRRLGLLPSLSELAAISSP